MEGAWDRQGSVGLPTCRSWRKSQPRMEHCAKEVRSGRVLLVGHDGDVAADDKVQASHFQDWTWVWLVHF